MIAVRSGSTELTDILLTGDDINLDIQENVRISILDNLPENYFLPSPFRVQDGQLFSFQLREEM